MTEAQKFPQYVAAFIAAGGAFAIGTMLGWTNPVEMKVKEGAYEFDVNDNEFSWIGASLPLGAAISCIPSGFMIDRIGRQLTLCILTVPFTIGWLMILFAKHLTMLYIGRIILGLACGATCVAVPMYIGEIAQKEIRGILGSFFQLLTVAGILFVYVAGAFLEPMPLTICCSVVPLIFSLSMNFMPESPIYLISKENENKAAKAIVWLRGKDYDSKAEMETLKEDAKKSKEEQSSFFSGFKTRACAHALFISLGLMFFQQFSGINAVIFYSTTIFQLAGSSLEPRFSTILIGFLQVVATIIAVIFVDRLGRRLLLLISAAIMALSTFILGMYFFFREMDENSVKNIGWLPISALCVFIVIFSFGFGPVPWLMTGELFPPKIKGTSGSLAGTANWLMAFLISKGYVDVKNAIGIGVTFWLFASITVLGYLFVLFFVPETKGKSLTEIQEILSKSD